MRNVDAKIEEFTLLLLYLNSWVENDFGQNFRRSWKGYDFNVLNKLSDDALIYGSKRSKSVGLSELGIEKAKQLLEKYNVRI